MKTQIDSTLDQQDPAATGSDEPDMMKIAEAADAEVTAGLDAGAAPDQTKGDAKKKDDGKKTAAGKDGKPPAEGKDGKPPADGKANTEKKDGDAKPGEESEFAKAKKENERKDRSWQALEKEKTEMRTEKAAFTAELQALRREVSDLRKKSSQPSGPVKDSRGLTVSDYERLEKQYKDNGNDEMAEAAKAAADALRKQAPAQSQAADAEPWKSSEFQAERQRHIDELMQQDPELAKTATESPLVKATNDLVNHPVYSRFFRAHPDGIKMAVEVAKLMRDANGAQEIKTKLTQAEEELKTSKAEVERLNGLLQPRGSHPSGAPQGKKDGPLTDDDVKAIAAAADRGELDS